MKKSMGKRLISGVTSAVLAVTYTYNVNSIPGLRDGPIAKPLAAQAAHSDGSPQENDGLPILSVPYEQSRWYRGGPLGVAGDFHIFAFDSALVDKHTNGNVAAPTVIGGNASPNQYIGRLVNVVGEKWDTSSITLANITDVVIPKDYEMYAAVPEGDKLDYPSIKNKFIVQDDTGKKMDMNHNTSVPSYMAHWSNDFINFEAMKAEYETKSDNFAAKSDSVAKWEAVNVGTTDKVIYIWLNPEGENVINLKPGDLLTESGDADHCKIKILGLNLEEYDTCYTDKDGNPQPVKGTRINGNQSLIINFDMEGYEGNVFDFDSYSRNIEYYGIETADMSIAEASSATQLNIKNGEGTVANGTNVLINFANAPDCATGDDPALRINVGLCTASILAPNVDLHVNNTNGTFIAQRVSVEGETHMAYFMQPLSSETSGDITTEKTWSDGNDDHSGDEVRVTLYRTISGNADLNTLESKATEETDRVTSERATAESNRASALAELWKTAPIFEGATPKNDTLPEGYKDGDAVDHNSDIKLVVRALENSGDRTGEPKTDGDVFSNTSGIQKRLRYAFDDYSVGMIKSTQENDEYTIVSSTVTKYLFHSPFFR